MRHGPIPTHISRPKPDIYSGNIWGISLTEPNSIAGDIHTWLIQNYTPINRSGSAVKDTIKP